MPVMALLLAACGSKPTGKAARLSGKIEGLGNDTIYVIGMDRLFDRTDTLVVKNDKFSDTLSIDTLSGVYLLFSDGTEYPLYADCRQHINLSGSTSNLHTLKVTGNVYNEEQTAFQLSLDSLGTTRPDAVQEKAEDFIRAHTSSLVSVYLLDKYFVQTPRPDYERISHLAELLTGELKDRPYLTQLLEKLESAQKMTQGRQIPFFQTTDADGKKINRTQFNDRMLLISVWASWDEASRKANAPLRKLYKQQKSNKDFAMLGISLDTDRNRWQEAVRRDTLEWQQACDLGGWHSDIVQKFSIFSLPFNVLVNENGRIMGMNLTLEEIEQQLKDPSVVSSARISGRIQRKP